MLLKIDDVESVKRNKENSFDINFMLLKVEHIKGSL